MVPQGVIAIWTGLLSNIPANWLLCDGNNGTPNLVARFIRGAPPGTQPGSTGGSDSHTHTSMSAAGAHTHVVGEVSHQHTVNSAGAHTHSGSAQPSGSGTTGMFQSAGAHTHTTNSTSHSHTLDASSNHTHTGRSADGRPPYYEVAFIQAGIGAEVPSNLVIIWAGLLADIPQKWSLCDGQSGRPDLRSKFIRGINTHETDPGTTGGSDTHTHTEDSGGSHSHNMQDDGSHYHTFNYYTWTHDHNSANATLTSGAAKRQTAAAGHHTHGNSDTIGSHNHNPVGVGGNHSHTVNSASSLPSYYDVAYIINDGGATVLPAGGILIWTGLIEDIPNGWKICDGNDGRPDLRGKFVRGANPGVNPGGTGGSDTHTHTDNSAGSHSNHSQTLAGAHQHSNTDNIGAHTHSVSAVAGAAGARANDSAGSHSHTYNSEGTHSNHTLASAGAHNHNPWSTDDGRPAFYEIAFIILVTVGWTNLARVCGVASIDLGKICGVAVADIAKINGVAV